MHFMDFLFAPSVSYILIYRPQGGCCFFRDSPWPLKLMQLLLQPLSLALSCFSLFIAVIPRWNRVICLHKVGSTFLQLKCTGEMSRDSVMETALSSVPRTVSGHIAGLNSYLLNGGWEWHRWSWGPWRPCKNTQGSSPHFVYCALRWHASVRWTGSEQFLVWEGDWRIGRVYIWKHGFLGVVGHTYCLAWHFRGGHLLHLQAECLPKLTQCLRCQLTGT